MHSKKWTALGRDRSGTVGALFGLAVIPMIAVGGLAIDYARALDVRSQLQTALDAAVLAAARDPLAPDTELEAIANAIFHANKPSGSAATVSGQSFALNGNTVSYSATASVPTTLAAIMGTQQLTFNLSAKAHRKSDGTEIVIALDTTGSMGFGNSWTDAKSAMAEMLIELDSLAQCPQGFHAAFVPFSDRVNVGFARAQQWLSVSNPPDGELGAKPNGTSTNKGCLEPRDQLVDGNPNALTDDSPSALGFLPSSQNYWISDLANQNYFTCPQQSIIGPTQNIANFQSTIEQLPLEGTGRFDEGLAWAYRLLSPKWQGAWGASTYPAEYGTMSKIAVFITDAYTEAYRREVPNQSNGGTNAVLGFNQGSTVGFENLVEVCNRMKDDGIVIHTIYVNGNDHGVPFLQQCATDSDSHYHDVTDISGLKKALRRIANSIVQVRLTE